MKKIFVSISIIAVVAVIAVTATRAYFTDTATISGNTFTSGTMDLRIDKNPDPAIQDWNNGFTNPQNPFVNVKPGDSGSQIIDIKNVGSVDGLATIKFDTTTWSALGDNLNFVVTYDKDNNGTFETPVAAGLLSAWNHNTYTLGALNHDQIASVKIEWSVPTSAGNNIQGASITLDTVFGLTQAKQFTLTDPSDASELNRSTANGLPYFTYVINGQSIDFTLHNPTGHTVYFDYAKDGEPGHDSPGNSNITISHGPLNGQLVGNIYNSTSVVANNSRIITVTANSEIRIGMHFGPEQNDYLDWATFTAK